MAHGLDKGVILSVARCTSLELTSVDFNLHVGTWLQAVGGRHHVADEAHPVARDMVAKHVVDDVGQVFLSDDFLLLAKFSDAGSHQACLLGCELKAQFFKVFGNVGPAGVLTQCIFASTSEALGHQCILIELMFAIAIGVHSCHLCKHILSDDGHVGCNGNAAIALHKMTQVVEFFLTDVGFGIEVITENGLHTG